MVLRNQVKSSRKYRVSQRLVRKKRNLQRPGKGYTKILLVAALVFLRGSSKDQKNVGGPLYM